MSTRPTKPTLLVVDESDENFATMERILLRSAVASELHRCSHGGEAVKLLDGWHHQRIPVVISSTSSCSHDIDEGYERRAHSYPVKDMDYPVFKHAEEQFSSYWLQFAQLPVGEDRHRAA